MGVPRSAAAGTKDDRELRRIGRRDLLHGLALAGAGLPLLALAGCAGAVPRAQAEPVGTPTASGSPVAASLATGPRPSGDFEIPGKIAYVKAGDILAWSAGKSRQVTRGNAYQGPAWSSDGTRLAASFMGENHSEIVILTEEGQKVRQVTHNFSNISISDQSWGRKPVWSPDDLQIAYVSDQGPIDMSLFIVDVDGTGQHRVVTQKLYSGGLDWPTWSKDGIRIAYTEFDSGMAQIQVCNLSTDTWKTLTEHVEGCYAPDYSPDGQHIAYTVREKGKHEIYVMDADGANPAKLTEGGMNTTPVWSPDGQLISYLASSNDCFDIMVMKVDVTGAPIASVPKAITHGEYVESPSGLSWTR